MFLDSKIINGTVFGGGQFQFLLFENTFLFSHSQQRYLPGSAPGTSGKIITFRPALFAPLAVGDFA
jgi:hypothetical protein